MDRPTHVPCWKMRRKREFYFDTLDSLTRVLDLCALLYEFDYPLSFMLCVPMKDGIYQRVKSYREIYTENLFDYYIRYETDV